MAVKEIIYAFDGSIPKIEMVGELVRCKDCMWYRDYDGCFFSTAEVEPNGFCSYGERKESEE